MAQPNQPPGNHSPRNPNRTKTPIVVEPVNKQQQRESVVEVLTQTATPEVQVPRGSLDPSSILRTGSIPTQAAMLKRLNVAQGHEAARPIGSTQGNRRLPRVMSTIKSTPSKPRTSRAPSIQTKLTISKPDDQYKEKADQVADQVMRIAAPPSPPQMSMRRPSWACSALFKYPCLQVYRTAEGFRYIAPEKEM